MHILLLTWNTGEHEWYAYPSRSRLLLAKETWQKDSSILLVKALFANEIDDKAPLPAGISTI